jgi:hypothetical protein
MRSFSKPTLGEIHSILRSKLGLIVHFSGTPPAGNTPIRYPDDLRNVIAGGAQDGVPCSVVMPRDIFTGAGERNSFGTIGVILDLLSDQSLATATRYDGGSIWNGSGPREFDERDLTIAEVEATLGERDGHNEWGIRHYLVRGLFLIEPIEISRYHPDFGDVVCPYTQEKVRADFPGQRIYSFEGDHIVELHPRTGPVHAMHQELYR